MPAGDGGSGYRPSSFETPPLLKGGCCFLIALLILLLAGCVGYVEIKDRRAVAAAKARCQPDRVLQVRQAAVWNDYLRRLPPTEPYGDFLIQTGQIRRAMGIRTKSFNIGDDHELALLNANGEIARLSFVRADSIGFSIEGVPTTLFSCYDRSRSFYRYSYAF